MFLLDKPRFIERKLCIIHEISIQLRQQIRCCRSFYADKSEFEGPFEKVFHPSRDASWRQKKR